jgi:hypothetical protein
MLTNETTHHRIVVVSTDLVGFFLDCYVAGECC